VRFKRVMSVLLLCTTWFLMSACTAQTVIYEKTSRYNTIFVTEDPEGVRTMLFERYGARQSVVTPGDPGRIHLSYARTAMAGLALAEQPRRILVVGLGGGTIPSFLRRHYPEAQIDVAELDPDVAEVARRFFGFREDEKLRTHVGDGRAFIEKLRGPVYDVIFLDAYGTDSVPTALTTREFLLAVRRALQPGGVVIGNVWAQTHNPLFNSMLRTYQDVFQDLYILEVAQSANRIVLALPSRRALNETQMAERASKIGRERHFGFDAGELVKPGFTHVRDEFKDGRVLLDSAKPVTR